MTQITSLLEIRKEIKERKPVFIRQDNPKRRKLNYKWRRPKGIHSKIRHHFKGRRKMPSPGYKSPFEVKGMHSSGLEIIMVSSSDGVTKIKKDTQGIIIPKAVGKKKKLEILKKAKELGVQVLNFNLDEGIRKIEDFMKSKSQKKTEVKKEVESKKEDKKQKGDAEKTKEKPEEKLTDEQKKEAEKREKDKVLMQKV